MQTGLLSNSCSEYVNVNLRARDQDEADLSEGAAPGLPPVTSSRSAWTSTPEVIHAAHTSKKKEKSF